MWFDGNPIDMATISVAMLSCLIRPTRRYFRHAKPHFTYDKLVVDFLNGTVLVPFFLMVGAVFSQPLLQQVLRTNKLFMAVGGVIGLFFVLREYLKSD
ncbi:MAG TPA: hypothetical protein VF861_07835 [Telluria sp.]